MLRLANTKTSHSGRLVAPVVPVGKPRMTVSDRWKNRPAVVRYHVYCDTLQAALPGFELPEELRLEFVIPMPPSWSKKKKQEMVGKPHRQRPDIDNLAKAFMDAFKTEDSHVHSLNAVKRWGFTGEVVVYDQI